MYRWGQIRRIPSVSPQLNIIVLPLQINAPPSQALRRFSVHICIIVGALLSNRAPWEPYKMVTTRASHLRE